MGNTQKEATVHAPARLAALRASAPRITARIVTAAHRVILSAYGVIISAARILWAGPLGRWLTGTVLPAGARGVTAAGTAAAPAGRAVARVVLPAAASGVSAARAGTARVTSALPPRAKVPAAATAVLALAAAVTAILTAIGPAAAVGPVGPAIAASALHPAAATAPGHAAAKKPAADAVAAAAAPRRHVVAAPASQHAAAHRRADAAPAARHAAPAARHAASAVRHAAPPRRHQQQPVLALNNWHAITEAAAGHPGGGALAPAQRLLPAALAGGQATLPITPVRAANAQLITQQALRLHMGIRSAVIAVATAMQESTLENLHYGDRDSLGLFQQRPSAGWGTPAEVTNPVYAADAFLHALAGYQAAHPGWATQPLYEAAQGVQGSAFPYAYAQWESQAAHIVAQATRHLL